MIIENELYFNMSIGSYTDFIKYSDLILLRIIEHGGAGCVELTVTFRTDSLDIKNLIIANNKIKISVGPSPEKCETFTVYPYEIDPAEDSSGSQYIITFTATPCLNFITDRSTESFKGTSAEVINQISKKYFNKEAHIHVIPFEEPSTWIRSFKTGAQYMVDTWLHMYLGKKGCPIMYINKDCEVYVEDLDAVKKSGPKFRLVPNITKASTIPTYQYLNKFNIESYKYFTNEFTGYGDITTINDISAGKDSIFIPENSPDLASTSEVEKAIIQNTRYTDNLYQTDNTHVNYQKAYKNNVSRLMRLNGIETELQVSGFHPELHILDLADIDSGNLMDSGLYLLDTKMFEVGYNTPATTTLVLTRDNRNRIEDFNTESKKDNMFNILNNVLAETLQMIRNLRRVVVMGRQLVNGHFLWQTIKFLNSFKYGLLTSFSVFGTTLNFNDSLALVESLKAAGNSFCNQIVNAFIPYPFSYALRNFAVEKPSLKTIVSRLVQFFNPQMEGLALVEEMIGLYSDLTGSASKIYDSNYSTYKMSEYASNGYSTGTLTPVAGGDITLPNGKGDGMDLVEKQKVIQEITNEFINNTEGVDIPISQISLTEAEALLPEDKLKELLADKTVEQLTQQGYLQDIDNFKHILLGIDPMDFNTINKINKNIGNILKARYWGTFTKEDEITNFYILNSYKDIYVTPPTTKIINAIRGSRVFIAFPNTEKNLVFYLNNKEVEMTVMENMDLGMFSISGYPIYYNVYLSQEKFNSNSVVLEVRRSK